MVANLLKDVIINNCGKRALFKDVESVFELRISDNLVAIFINSHTAINEKMS